MADLIELDIECQMNNADVNKEGGKSLEYSDQVSGETSSSTPLTVSCQDDCSNEESSLESFSLIQKKGQMLPASISQTVKITSIDEESKTKDENHLLEQPSAENSNPQYTSSNGNLQKRISEKSIRIDMDDDDDDGNYKPGQIEVGWNTSSGVDSYTPSEDENDTSVKNIQSKNDDGTMFEDFPVFEDFPDKDEDEIRITRNETIENQTNIEEEFDSRRPWRKAPLENEYNYSGTDSDTQTEVTEILNTDFDTTSISGNEMLQMNLYISGEQIIMPRDGYGSGGRTPSDRSTSVSSEITEVKKSKSALNESQFYMNGINRNLPLSRKYYEKQMIPQKQNDPNPYTPQAFRGFPRQEGTLTLITEDNKSIEGNSDENDRNCSEINKSMTSINDSHGEENSVSPRRKSNSQRKLLNTSPKSPQSESDSAELHAKTPNVIEASLNELNEFSRQKDPLLPNKSKHDDKNTSNQNEMHGLQEPSSPQYRKMLLVDGQNAPSVQMSKRDIIAAGGKEKIRSNDSDYRKLSSEALQTDHATDQIQDGNSNEKSSLENQDESSQSGGRRRVLNETKGLSNQSVSNQSTSNQSERNLVDRAFKGFPLRSIRHRGRLERRWPRLYRYRKGFLIGILAFFLVAGTGIVIIQFSPEQKSDVNISETKSTFVPTSSPTQSITLQPSAQMSQLVKFLDPNLPYSEMKQIFGQQLSARAGTSISFSGDGTILAIGAPNASGRTITAGAVYIYKYGQDGYSQLGNSIEGSNTGDEFGWSVSLASDGSRVAIGARSSSNIKTKNGCVKIYTFDEDKDSWDQLGSDLNGLDNEERSGWSVALSGNGNRVAIGGPQGDINSDENRLGSVTVFEYSDLERNWLQLGNVRRGAGSSVSLSYDGSHLIFGVFRSINKNNVTIGHVEVHHFTETSSGDKLWTQIGENIEGSNLEDQIGRSVSINSDGSRIAIGIDGFDSSDKTNVGCCRVFDLMEASDGKMEWIQAGSDLVGHMAGEESGVSVSISGNGRRVACGGPRSGHNGINSGVVRVYDVTDGTWTMVGDEMVAPAGSEFGSSVALTNDGSYLAIGAPMFDNVEEKHGGFVGIYRVQIFSPDRIAPLPEVTIKPTEMPTRLKTSSETISRLSYRGIQNIFGQQLSARAGTSISFSGDGTILAIGAPNASGRTITAGAVYIYKYGQDGYSQLGNSIEGSNTGDEFGWSVSLASDGSRVAIGARSSSNIKTKNGCVKIYTFDEDKDSWDQLGSDLNGLDNEERSGWSVALSGNGNRVAIGGPQGDINSDENRLGSVTVFEYSDLERNWLQLGNVRRGAGSSVSLSYDGSHLIFGVFRSINKNNVTIGHVEVHHFTETSSGDKLWTQIGENIEGSNLEDQIGRSVSINSDGSRIAIGIDGFDSSDKTNVGCCRVFDLMEASDGKMEWIQAGSDLVGHMAGEESGVSVSISGNGRRVACGGPRSGHNGINSGVVRVYDVTDGTWTMVGDEMVAPAGSEFGSSVALTNDGSYLVIGGPGLDRRGRNLGGVIRVFEEKSTDY